MKKQDLPWLAIECTTQQEYTAIREKLDELGYEPNPESKWSDLRGRNIEYASHVLCVSGFYGIYNHNGNQPVNYTQLTFNQFIEKYGNEPTPAQRIAQLEVEIRDLKERLKKYEPQVYEGVFVFDGCIASCIKGKGLMRYDDDTDCWDAISVYNVIYHLHTLTETPTHERGQFYLLYAADPTSPQSYALCMGDWFVGWGNKLPIERKACDVSLMKVVPVNQ
jgi:hypothetical protein